MELGPQLLKDINTVRCNELHSTNVKLGFMISFFGTEATILSVGQPYRLQEDRTATVTNGSACILINLIEYIFLPDRISPIAPNPIIQIIEVSHDFDAHMVTVDPNSLPISGKEEFLTHFLQQKKNFLSSLPTEEQVQIENSVTVMWNILQGPMFRKEIIQRSLVGLLYNIEYMTRSRGQTELSPLTHQDDIFRRLISLVNIYSKTEWNVSFYADKLCPTPRYLDTVIQQTSQQIVIDWINQPIILEAKVLLKHSDHLAYQISDESNFPNPSFFNKFSKRMAEMVPQGYQKS